VTAQDPAERVLIARLGAFERWKQCGDTTAATAPARQGLADRFVREVDPQGVLDPAERARRAESARKAFYIRLALKSAQARRARRLAGRPAAQVEDGPAQSA
jgi:hypothetical protein